MRLLLFRRYFCCVRNSLRLRLIFVSLSILLPPHFFANSPSLHFHRMASQMFAKRIPSETHKCVLVQRAMDFCLIGVNREWVMVTNLF